MFVLAARAARRAIATALLAGLLQVPAGAAEPGVSRSEIVVGQSITLQGGRNAYGSAAHKGAAVYLDALNAAGGVHGRRVLLRTLDDDNQPATAEANARQLADGGAFVLFGALEGAASTAVMKVAAEKSVPFIGPMAGPPSLRRPHQAMVFPVRAEHREEFRALLRWGRDIGLKTLGFFHADSANGREHLANVQALAREMGLQLVLPLPYKADAGDAELDAMARRIVDARPDLLINHGAAMLYQKLVEKAKKAGSRTSFMAVNSGSSQIAQALGPLAQGMVFSQVVPSPWERKHAITREYQDAMRRADPAAEFSYGSLEGYLTAKALATALRGAGPEPTRAALLRWLEAARFDLGGVKVEYAPGDHAGSRFVDLSIVSKDGRFVH